ncbi:MAG: VWA domain-containing protein [Ardenticatenales bacterium]
MRPLTNPFRSAATRKRWFIAFAGMFAAIGLASATARDTSVGAAPLDQTVGVPDGQGATYALVDTWEKRPWQLTAGRYGRTADISSAPDGTTYILDNRDTANRPGAIHVLDKDGIAQRVFTVPDLGGLTASEVQDAILYRPIRLDVGQDGTLYVLEFYSSPKNVGNSLFWDYRIAHLEPSGAVIEQFDVLLEPPRHYVDIAVGDDGRIYVSRAGQNPWCYDPAQAPDLSNQPGEEPSYSIDVYKADGSLIEQMMPPELKVPTMLDVGHDGRVWVLSRIPPPCGNGPGDPGQPTATPRPSLAGGADRRVTVDAAQQPPVPGQPVNGIVVFRPDHSVEEGITDLGDDEIAVGPAGVFVTRNVDIYRVRDAEPVKGGRRWVESDPLFTGPTDHVYSGFLRRILFNLDVPADGRLLASMNHCYFQGLVSFDDVTQRPLKPRFDGGYDAPELEGPAYPIRVAAAEDVGVLLGRMLIGGSRLPGGSPINYNITNWTTDGQTVQRWSPDGQLGSQLGLCPDADIWFGSDAWVTRDIAMDGKNVYTIDPDLLQKRPDDTIPAWTYWPGQIIIDDLDKASFLGAITADDGLVATLDLGANSVVIVDDAGALVRSWSIDAGGDIALPTDIAMHGDRIYIADQARSRVYVRDLEGRAVADWPLHDGPRAIAAGPGGDVIVLGRGGWGHHYTPDGRLVASWPMPDAGVEPRDIAVGDDGRVYVNFVRLGPTLELGWDSRSPIERAGVWVFERAAAPVSPPPPPRGCVPSRDKTAAPHRIPLGQTVDVQLTVDGWCPGQFDKADIVIVFDTSRSMTFQDSFGQGKSAALAFLAELDGANTRVGLVSFDSGPTLVSPLTNDIAAIRARITALSANGDTQLSGALDAARFAFQTAVPPTAADTRKLVVLITDGIIKDDPLPVAAVDALDAAGAVIHALVFPSWDFNNVHRDNLDVVVGNARGDKPGRVHMNPTESQVEDIARDLTGYRPEKGLFQTITIVDQVPTNMTYVANSAIPPATFDAAANTLTWRFGATPAAETLRMTYRLRPLQVGTWPTNVRADATYRDALGNDGAIVFPVPEVEVYGLDHRVYLPIGMRAGCLIKRRPLDVALVIDASSSMTEPSATGSGTKLDAARAAARAFIDLIDRDDRVAIVSFNAAATLHAPLTADVGVLGAALDAITSEVGTRIDLGLGEGDRALEARRATALPVLIVLTDGLQNDPPGDALVVTAADSLKVNGAILYTIGLGNTIDQTLLRQIATSPDRFYPSPSDSDLARIYADIQGRLACDGQ